MRYREIIEAKPRKPVLPSAGTSKPVPPLTPAQSRRRAEQRAGIQQRIRDERARSAQKLQDLGQSLIKP